MGGHPFIWIIGTSACRFGNLLERFFLITGFGMTHSAIRFTYDWPDNMFYLVQCRENWVANTLQEPMYSMSIINFRVCNIQCGILKGTLARFITKLSKSKQQRVDFQTCSHLFEFPKYRGVLKCLTTVFVTLFLSSFQTQSCKYSHILPSGFPIMHLLSYKTILSYQLHFCIHILNIIDYNNNY